MRGRRRRRNGPGDPRTRAPRIGASPCRLLARLLLLLAASASATAAPRAATAPFFPLAPLPAPQRVDGLLRCSAERVLRPLSTADVARMVSGLYREALAAGAAEGLGDGTAAAPPAPPPPVRVRATHSRFHTPTALACPGEGQQPQGARAADVAAAALLDAPKTAPTARVASASAEGVDARSAVGTGAAAPPAGLLLKKSNSTDAPRHHPARVALLTDALDAVLEVQPAPASRVRVQAGMTVGQLLAAASAVNLSVPVGALPSFSGLTLGGALATAAHGSGPSSLADMVVEATWVDGTGTVHTSSLLPGEGEVGSGRNSGSGSGTAADIADANAGRALIGGLGLTGVVTELLLQLQPPTLTHALAALDVPDADLAADVRDLLRSTPHVTVVWRPDLKRYSAWALYEETAAQAERRRRRERRAWLDGAAGGAAQQQEEKESEDDARAAAPAVVVAAAPPADARALLAWQRDVNLQGGAREEAVACALARGQALATAPFAYPPSSPAAGWRRVVGGGGGGGSGGSSSSKVAAGGRRRSSSNSERQPSSSPLLSLLRRGRGARRGAGGRDASAAPPSAPAASSGARIPATDRFTAAFVGPTNAMAAAGCAPSEAAAARKKGGGGASLCAWVAPAGAGGQAAAASTPSTPAPPAPVRTTRGGSGFHLALDASQLEAWIDDARWALDADLRDDAAVPGGDGRCLPPGGFVLRFGAGIAGKGEEGDEEEEGEREVDDASASSSDDRDVRMDLAAPPDPAQLDDDARAEAAAAAEALSLPPALAAAAAANANATAPAAAAVLEVDEASAAGFLSPVVGLERPVYIQAIAATFDEGGQAGGAAGAPAAPGTPHPTTPAITKYGWVLDALERFTYCAYNASAPHWGDSSERALLLAAGGGDAACGVGAGAGAAPRLPGFAQQLEAQRRYDPLRLFEPELFSRVRRGAAAADEARRRRAAEEEEEGGGGAWEGEDGAAGAVSGAASGGADGCAADGSCWCTEDRHCAPGFGCVESNAFSGVMVCKPWAVIAAAETAPVDDGP